MENRSKHYGDVEKWVRKVIDSCETYQQIFGAKNLIKNFEDQMKINGVNKSLIWSVGSSLYFELTLKRNELLKKQM